MIEETKNIDQLFKNAFESYSPETPQSEWPEIDNALKRQNFFKFGVHSFNIFYASIITVAIGVGLFVGLGYKNSERNIQIKNTFQHNTQKNFDSLNYFINNSKFLQTEQKLLPTKKLEKICFPNTKYSISDTIALEDTTTQTSRLKNLSSDSTNTVLQQPTPERKRIIKRSVIIKNVVVISDTVVRYKEK
jgi:hypothetical protein